MKKVLKCAEPEEAVYYSDFSGKLLEHNMIPVTVTINAGMGQSMMKPNGKYI
jgi:hypothetical protein